jgi:hypothetical protein
VEVWLHPDSFDIVEDFEYNCTPRLRREVRQILFEHFDQIVALHGGSVLEEIVGSKTKPVLARAIETMPDALILIMESGLWRFRGKGALSGLPALP